MSGLRESGNPSVLLVRRKSAKSGCEQPAARQRLFDDLVRDGEQPRREAEAQCLGGVEVDYSNLIGCMTGRSAGFSPLTYGRSPA
jgi:hypothetical protein